MNPIFLTLTIKGHKKPFLSFPDGGSILINLANISCIWSNDNGCTNVLEIGSNQPWLIKESVAEIEIMIAEKTALSKES